MRNLLLSTLLAVGVGLIGTGGASAMMGPGILNKAASNFSPRVRQVTHQCRAKTVCDSNGKNCHTVDVCR